jgi:hypothetical protein
MIFIIGDLSQEMDPEYNRRLRLSTSSTPQFNPTPPPSTMSVSLQDLQSQLNSLQGEVGTLRQEVTRLNDIQAIRTLHFKYGYYWDNVLYDQVIDLFTDDVKVLTSYTYLT